MGNSVLQSGASIGAIVTPQVIKLLVTDQPGSWRSTFIIVGAAGEESYATRFSAEAETLQKACAQGGVNALTIGLQASETNSLDLFKQAVSRESSEEIQPLWIVMLGHGSFDGREAKFNLRGPDIAVADLVNLLQPFKRPFALVDCSSASAPFMSKLSGKDRVIITATRSGYEQNYARFGSYLAELLTDPAADLDKDGQVSLLEAFLAASRRTVEFYKGEGRLVTEHALLDDNADGLGTPAEWFQGLRATKKAKDKGDVDGILARYTCLVPNDAERQLTSEQRVRRDALERQVLLYREKKASVPDDEYYRELERLLLQLARFTASNSPAASN